MFQILEDLNNCEKMLLSLKANYQPIYRNLLIQWRDRKDELKKQLSRELSVKAACILIMGVHA